MRQRRLWTAEQDKALKYLKEQQKIKKWSTIARMMQEDYQMPNRSGKQCRERYFNHLDSEIRREEWTEEEERVLWDLHSQYGNRWTLMTNQIKGRSQNCIKNHFYSKLRKAVRRLNKVIIEKFKTQYKQIKTSLLYKILESAEDKFKPGKSSNIENMDAATSIKNRLFMYQSEEMEKQKQYEVVKILILDIQSLQEKLKIQSRHQKNASGFLDPKVYRRMDNLCESEDNISVYSSTSFNSSFQPSDDESDIMSHSERSRSVKLKKRPLILNKSITDDYQYLKGQQMQEQEKSLRYTWSPSFNAQNHQKQKKENNLLGNDLAQSMKLRPSKSERSISFQLNIEDKVSDIEPIKKTDSCEYEKCISDIAKNQNYDDELEFYDDDFLDIKSDREKDDFLNIFEDPKPIEFQLRIFSPKVPSDDGKMIDELLLLQQTNLQSWQ